jgi:hypothetical protein
MEHETVESLTLKKGQAVGKGKGKALGNVL